MSHKKASRPHEQFSLTIDFLGIYYVFFHI